MKSCIVCGIAIPKPARGISRTRYEQRKTCSYECREDHKRGGPKPQPTPKRSPKPEPPPVFIGGYVNTLPWAARR